MTTLRHRRASPAASGNTSHRSNWPFPHASQAQTATKVVAFSAATGFTNSSGTITGTTNAGTALTNDGKITGTADAKTNLNNTGTIGAGAKAGTEIVNTGTIGAGASAATTLTNSGHIGIAPGLVEVSAATLINTGTIGYQSPASATTATDTPTPGASTTVIKATTVDNHLGTLKGDVLNVTAQTLLNQQGTVQASTDLQIHSSATLNNTQGTIQSSGTLTIADPLAQQSATSKTLHITNTDGLIKANTAVDLSAAALSFDGQVKSSGDLAAALHGDYSVSDKPFYEAAGSVSLAFTGRITNNTELRNDKNLSLRASEIVNNATVRAEGSLAVHATSGDLTNKGTLYSGGHADIAASGNLYNEGATIDTGSLRLDVGGSVYSSTAVYSTTSTSSHTLHNGEQRPTILFEHSGVDFNTFEQATRTPDPHSTTTVTDTSTSQSTGNTARITARSGDISLTVGQDLHIQGATLHASGSLLGLVGGDIDATSLRLRQNSQHSETTTRDADEWERPVHTTHTSEQAQGADIQAGAGLTLYAAGNANYQGSTLHSGADLTLLAGKNLTLGADLLTTEHQQSGTHEQTQTLQGGHTTAQGPILLAAGDTITLHSADIETGKTTDSATSTSDANTTNSTGDTPSIVLLARQIQAPLSTRTDRTEKSTDPSAWLPPTVTESREQHASVGSTLTTSGDLTLLASAHGPQDPLVTKLLGDAAKALGKTAYASKLPSPHTSRAQPAIKDVANPATPEAATIPAPAEADNAIDLQSITLRGKTVTIASTGNIAITSGQNTTASQYTADAHAESHSSTTTQASTLSGDTVTVEGHNVTLSATDITASGAVGITAADKLVMGYTVDSSSDYTLHHSSSGGWLDRTKTVNETNVTDTRARTTHVTGASIDIHASGNADLFAPELRVVGKAHVNAGGKLNVYALQGEHSDYRRKDSSSAFLGGMVTYNRDNNADTRTTPNTLVAKLIAPEELHLQSGGDMRLQAPEFDSAKTIFKWGTASRIDQTTGKPTGEGAQLIFEGVKEGITTTHQGTSANLLWQKQTSSVTEDETLRVAHFTQPEGVQLIPGSKAGGVVVDVEKTTATSTPSAATNTLLATLQGASAKTGTGTAPSIEHNAIDLTHTHVEKTQEGLTPEGAAVIAIAVTVATAGAGSGVGASVATSAGMTTAAGTAGASTLAAAGTSGLMLTTTGAIVANGVAAGVTSLAVQGSIGLINNQGDISKTLEQLTSERSLNNLGATMLTAGALYGLGSQITLDVPDTNGTLIAKRLNDIKVTSGWAPNLAKNLITSATSATLNTAINGGDWGANLGHGLTNGLIDTVAQQGAYAIGNSTTGQNSQPPTLDSTGKNLAHFALGCAVGSASAGSANGCAPGAIGAVVGENTAEYAKTHNLSNADALALAKVMAGTSGLLTGGMDNPGAVNIAVMTGGNAAENNFLGHFDETELKRLREKTKNPTSLTKDEADRLVRLEVSDQMSDGLLARRRAGETLSADEQKNLLAYLAQYQQQDGRPAAIDLMKNGSPPTDQFPYGGSADMQKRYMQKNATWLTYIAGRDTTTNEDIFIDARLKSGLYLNTAPNESFLPTALERSKQYATLDALINSPVLATGTYLGGSVAGVNKADLDAAVQFASLGSDVLSSFVLPKAGLSPVLGDTTASVGKVGANGGVVPSGFANANEFANFGGNVRGGLKSAGYPDVEPILQGSAVTGKSFGTGAPFDVGRVSDFDVALASPSLLQRAQDLGIGVRSGGTRTGPLSARDLEALGLTKFASQISTQAGREVNFMIYQSPAAAVQRAPSVSLPGGK